MPRPFYEQSAHRTAEDAVALRVAEWRGLQCVRFPVGATIDRALVRDGVITALLEIKTRRTPMGAYSTYCVSEERMNLFRLIAARLNVPAVLAVQWSDACGLLLDVRSAPVVRLQVGGRTDRGDARDTEPMLHYSVSSFRLLPGSAASAA